MKPLDISAIRERLNKASTSADTYGMAFPPEKNNSNWCNYYGFDQARTDIPALLEEVETLRSAVVEMTKALDKSRVVLTAELYITRRPEDYICEEDRKLITETVNQARSALSLPAVQSLRTEKTS